MGVMPAPNNPLHGTGAQARRHVSASRYGPKHMSVFLLPLFRCSRKTLWLGYAAFFTFMIWWSIAALLRCFGPKDSDGHLIRNRFSGRRDRAR